MRVNPLPARRTLTTCTRRELLQLGLSGTVAISLPAFSGQPAAASPTANRRTKLILVWLPGGASHLETWDPKPLAPQEYRGPFQPIATAAPGIDFCELLPRQAQVAHHCSILRSLVHTGFCHQQGTHQLLTGHPVQDLKLKPDHPDILSIAHCVRFETGRKLPNYIGVPGVNYSGAAYLGPAHEPFEIQGDPNSPQFTVPNLSLLDAGRTIRMKERLDLRQQFDRMRRDVDQMGQLRAFDAFETQAWNMLTGEHTRRAFDLSQEDPRVRDRYGRHRWGQQCLLARRLVEAGVELVTVQLGGDLCGGVGNWDDHAVNQNCFDAMKYRCVFFDQAVAALIEDVFERGLDKETLIVVTGEFGRTPKISYQASTGERIASASAGTMQPGRDHWPRATSVLFAGGGIRGGQIVGATDVRGEDATDHIVGRGDFLATLYRHLGIDPADLSFTDFSGRPVPVLQQGRPISQLSAT